MYSYVYTGPTVQGEGTFAYYNIYIIYYRYIIILIAHRYTCARLCMYNIAAAKTNTISLGNTQLVSTMAAVPQTI